MKTVLGQMRRISRFKHNAKLFLLHPGFGLSQLTVRVTTTAALPLADRCGRVNTVAKLVVA